MDDDPLKEKMASTAVAANAAVMLTPWGEKVTDDNAWRLYPRPTPF